MNLVRILLLFATAISGGALAVCILYSFWIVEFAPLAPDMARGLTIPVRQHGANVYYSRQQLDQLALMGHIGFVAMPSYFLLAVVYSLVRERSAPVQEPPPQ